MKTTHQIRAGENLLIRRSDGGIYLMPASRFPAMDAVRVGSSAAICAALASAFIEMAEAIRAEGK